MEVEGEELLVEERRTPEVGGVFVASQPVPDNSQRAEWALRQRVIVLVCLPLVLLSGTLTSKVCLAFPCLLRLKLSHIKPTIS